MIIYRESHEEEENVFFFLPFLSFFVPDKKIGLQPLSSLVFYSFRDVGGCQSVRNAIWIRP